MSPKFLAVGAAVATAFLPTVPAAGIRGVARVHECAGATARCDGTLSVPLDWSDPSSGRITVAFAWLPATGGHATGTILANPGGPLAALPVLPRIQQALGPVLEKQNLLVVEPRGLGTSSPLLCPGLNLTAPETIAACARLLGPRVRFFTADQAVHDMDAVRHALGVPKVAFYGNSYGTVFAQAYAARHPGSLSAAFLDSTTTTSAGGYALWPVRSRLDQLDLVCGRSRACRALPGTASGTWAKLLARLRAHPDPEVTIAALNTVGGVYDAVFGRESGAAATAYLHGDPAPLRRLARVVSGLPQQPVGGPEWAGYLAYRCGDGAFPLRPRRLAGRTAGPAPPLLGRLRHRRGRRRAPQPVFTGARPPQDAIRAAGRSGPVRRRRDHAATGRLRGRRGGERADRRGRPGQGHVADLGRRRAAAPCRAGVEGVRPCRATGRVRHLRRHPVHRSRGPERLTGSQ